MNLKELVVRYESVINPLVEMSKGVSYFALFLQPNPAFLESDEVNEEAFHEMSKVYVLGLVERAHLSSITSLTRTSRWLSAALVMAENKNILGYSAAVRGFLEGAADAFDLMSVLPGSIANAAPYWMIALHDPAMLKNKTIVFGELENKLIHYAYAGQVPKNTMPLPQHDKKTNAAYIRAIEAFGVPGAGELYAECCELTHPASPSVMCFLDETEMEITFNPDRDSDLIEDFERRHFEKISLLAQYSINPALISLALLGRLNEGYPMPSDSVISGIGGGRPTATVKKLEGFIRNYQSGRVDMTEVFRNA